EHVLQLPAQIVSVLDRGVGAEPVARGMAVHRVAHAEHTARGIMPGVHFVDGPARGRAHLDLEHVVADEIADDCDGLVFGEPALTLFDVITPDDQPLVPWPYHAYETGADAADLGTGLQ